MPYVDLGYTQTDVWPPDDEATSLRLSNYSKCRKLFKGKHADVYERVRKATKA